jgi:hypothetical protein
MGLPAEKHRSDQPDEPVRLLVEDPSETESGNKFIDSVASTIAREYGVGGDRLAEVVRNRVKATTDKLKREFSRDNEGNINPDDEENVNKIRAELKAELHHLLLPE